MLLGTMGYAAPEQLRGLQVDHRADIFSFGVILYEMLSGKRAFAGPTVIDTMTAILKDSPPDLALAGRHIPPALARIVDRCLEKNPAARLQSTRDLGFALEGLSSHSETRVAPIPAAGGGWWWSNPRVAWSAAAACAVGCLATLGLAAGGYLSPDVVDAPELRLQVHVPEIEAVAAGGLTNFALSPDGRQFVFTARNGDRSSLWLRSLNSDSSRAVEGTDGARNPFWSHDSRSVGFFANGQLKRVDLADGLVRTLTSAPISAGGAWNAEGTILFTRSFAGPIYKVPAGGGEPVPVTRTAIPLHSGHVFPEFLSDGRRFLFFAFGSAEGAGVYVGSLDSADVRRIAAADAAAAFMPPDRLLLPRGDALMSQQMNLASLEPRGEAITVAPGVCVDSINGKAVSASRVGPIAYRANAPERELVWLNRSGVRIGSAGEAHVDGPLVSMSPDGHKVAVVRRVDGNSDIWAFDLRNGALQRITTDRGHDAVGVWSPDGSQLVFGSDRRSGVLDLYVKKLNGPPETVLLESPTDKAAHDWSPDGKWIAYSNADAKTGRDLWAWPVGGGKPIPIATGPASEVAGRFSPDGRWIVFPAGYEIEFAGAPAKGTPSAAPRVRVLRDGLAVMNGAP